MSESETQDQHDSSNGDGKDEDGNILEDGGVDTDERAGRSQGIDVDSEPDEETKEEIEEERARRLDPDNRPDGAEVDNTQRTFDVDKGMFTDSEDYEEDGEAPYADPEDPESDASDDSDDDGDDSDDGDDDTGEHEHEDDSDEKSDEKHED